MVSKKRARCATIMPILWTIAIVFYWFLFLPAFNIKDVKFIIWLMIILSAVICEMVIIGFDDLAKYEIFIVLSGSWWDDNKIVANSMWHDSRKQIKWTFRVIVVAKMVLWVMLAYCCIINLNSWVDIESVAMSVTASIAILGLLIFIEYRVFKSCLHETRRRRMNRVMKATRKKLIAVYFIGAGAAFLMVSYFFGVLPLRAKDYSNLLRMSKTEGSVEDIPVGIERIAVMDTDSAAALGNTEIGSLSAKSQFVVSEDYIQLNVGGKPIKVSSLEYANIIKWVNNRKDGVPGYIEVDPVADNGKSEFVSLTEEDGRMVYVNSAAFCDNISLALRLSHPTLMFEKPHLELDEERHKWIVAPVYDYKIGLFGGKDIIGAIIACPFYGKWAEQYYPLEDIPEWVDYVFDGDLLCRQYNYMGRYSQGIVNSVIWQNNITKVTDGKGIDYGYLTSKRDILIYTGITSATKSESDHGFLLANERTGEAMFIECPSVNEWAAMESAEQEAYEKSYTACFPSVTRLQVGKRECLVYFGALKDGRGFIKRYYVVDVNQGSTVAVGDSYKRTINNFTNKVIGEPVESETSYDDNDGEIDLSNYYQISIVITDIIWPWSESNGMMYIVAPNGYYKAKFREEYVWLALAKGVNTTIWVNDNGYFYYEHPNRAAQ